MPANWLIFSYWLIGRLGINPHKMAKTFPTPVARFYFFSKRLPFYYDRYAIKTPVAYPIFSLKITLFLPSKRRCPSIIEYAPDKTITNGKHWLRSRHQTVSVLFENIASTGLRAPHQVQASQGRSC